MHLLLSRLKCRNMSNARADSSNIEQLKKLLTKLGTVLLQSCGSTETLLKNLDRLEILLSHVLQEYKEQLEMLLQQFKESLIASELIRHSELDVRVSVASCISQIIRITAPDEPYGEDHMKEFFQLAISAFERLSCMSGRVYLKAVSILKTMSYSQACVMMLDLELDTSIDIMFHLFLDGIRTSHPKDVFSNMENIMTLIIRNTVDDDELLFVLVKIILNSLRRENQNVSPVSFQLAENTFKNFSGDLKAYLPEAVRCLDFPIEDYAEVVVSFFQVATQRDNTEPKDTGRDISCPGEAGLAIESDLYNVIEGNETQNPDENRNENQLMISHCTEDTDILDKSVYMPQEQKPEEIHTRRKRHRRPSSLTKAEEGYDPNWMLVDWKSLEKPLKKDKKDIIDPAKIKISKESSPKPAGKYLSASDSPKPSKKKKDSVRNEGVLANKALDCNSEGKIIVSEDQARDITVKNHSEKGRGSSTEAATIEKSRGKTIPSEDLKQDIMSWQTSASQCRLKSSKAKALSRKVSKHPKGSTPHLGKRTEIGSAPEELIGCRIKVWWPLDRKFYKGKIAGFDRECKLHMVDYDDGEIEVLDLTRECWEMLPGSKLSGHDKEIDADSSSSKSKSKC